MNRPPLRFYLLLPLVLVTFSFYHPQTAFAVLLCDSLLHGPYCGFVNGRALPAHHHHHVPLQQQQGQHAVVFDGDAITEQHQISSTSAQQLQQLLHKLVEQLDLQKKKKNNKQDGSKFYSRARGRFRLGGGALLENNIVWLRPRKWVVKPGDNWIMLSLSGGLNTRGSLDHLAVDQALKPRKLGNSNMLVLNLGDPDTDSSIDQCSKLIMMRYRRGIKRNWLEGSWIGSYSCMGSRTLAKLIITTRRRKQERLVSASLIFDAELFPNRDSTEAGCKCMLNWVYEGKQFTNGQCAVTSDSNNRPWCFIEPRTCAKVPAGDNWDYCPLISSEPEDEKESPRIIVSIDQNGDFLFL